MSNNNLHAARKAKYDEFYTLPETIEAELPHYKEQFAGKVVYCNCDGAHSEFVKFFSRVKDEWRIKEVQHSSDDFTLADRRSLLCEDAQADMLDNADIVVTNPPFSIFDKHLSQILQHGKKFLVIGNITAPTYTGIASLVLANKMRCGYAPTGMFFNTPHGRLSVNACWYTNLFVDYTAKPDLELTATYKPETYPHYDNYDAVDVSNVEDIPADYFGAMGVPITYLNRHNGRQFDILDILAPDKHRRTSEPLINGKKKFARVIIKRKS